MDKALFPPNFRFGLLLSVLLSANNLASAKPGFTELLFNPNWYRTFDSTSSIVAAEGGLLFAWHFADPEMKPDSFFVGIDTLWSLPQDVDSDTSEDWDLQVCPDEICMDGLKRGIHGANSPYPFADGNFETEHHFQLFPAIDKNFYYTSPPRSVFGAMMFCRSRTSGISDTVFAFGTWNLKWDPTHIPPVRPVAGYLPKLSDFAISGDTVRYLKAGAGITPSTPRYRTGQKLHVAYSQGSGVEISFPDLASEKEVTFLRLDGTQIWKSGIIPASTSKISCDPGTLAGSGKSPGLVVVSLSWAEGKEWTKVALLPQ
ncbi:MAG: hypothetical protein JWO30_4693 [Fibrobacteres bacterium]|nr:hypothetical protein [Fibrobacterota bacterium]